MTPDMLRARFPFNRILAPYLRYESIRRVDQALKEQTWLNDEVINAYIQLLKERNERDVSNGVAGRMHFFHSFFYQTLTGQDG